MTENEHPNWLTTTDLDEPIERLLGGGNVVDTWECRQLAGLGRGLGTWRVAGSARYGEFRRHWSLVLKGWSIAEPNTNPEAWDWPWREVMLYKSGVFTYLPPGLRAPRCLGEIERPDGTVWLWLEDLGDATVGAWSQSDFERAAFHLGQFGGAYLSGRPMPDQPYLSNRWLGRWVEAAAPQMAQLEHLASNPRVAEVYPPAVVERFDRLWSARHVLLNAIDTLPRTFCHRDAFRRNLFLAASGSIPQDLVAIDWEFAGLGCIGEELPPLIIASALFFDLPSSEIERLERHAFAAYVDGLRNAGWDGDVADVRKGYTVSCALRFGPGMARMIPPSLADEQRLALWEASEGQSEAEIVEQYAAINRWLAISAAEALDAAPRAMRGGVPA